MKLKNFVECWFLVSLAALLLVLIISLLVGGTTLSGVITVLLAVNAILFAVLTRKLPAETREMTLGEFKQSLYYKPNMAAVWNFANHASGFLYGREPALETEGLSSTQRLAQKIRDTLPKDSKELTLIQRIKLYSFIEVKKNLEILNKERISGARLEWAIIGLVLIMGNNELIELVPDAMEKCLPPQDF